MYKKTLYLFICLLSGSIVAYTQDTASIKTQEEIWTQTDTTEALQTGTAPIPVIELEDAESGNEEDGINLHVISSVLTASRDPFLNTAAFVFGQYRFQPRGYGRNQQQVLINGIPMNDLRTGAAYWSQWGGLNDMFRARNNTYGLAPSDDAYGGMNGATSFDVSAAAMQKQTRLTYSLSNRQYRHRLMLTHNSGLLANGWAYALSFSRRWAKEGYIPGTFYDGYGAFGSLSRQAGRHSLDLTGIAAPARRGKSAPATKEAYELAGSNFYNPNWGYQNGSKRNAKISESFQPIFLFRHRYAGNKGFQIHTSLGYQFGKNTNSALDWYQAKDPRPDYYRYLPSWQTRNNDPDAANDIIQKWNTEPEEYAQINWNRLYEVNYTNTETITDVNGITGNNVTGKRSVYVIGNDVEDLRKYSFNTRLEQMISERFALQGGVSAIIQQMEYYKELQDLLGGDFYLNLNQFADQQHVPNAQYNQYDLNTPDRLIREGDKYNYHYFLRQHQYLSWLQGILTLNRLDIFLAAKGSWQHFSREGLFRSGLFPEDSYGKADPQSFTTYGIKGGITWKISGRNYIFLNGAAGTEAPASDHTYISIRTRNQTVRKPVAQSYNSLEGGYLLKAPHQKARLVGYLTDMTGITEIKRFYNDDPAFRTFVNYLIQDAGMRFAGLELALEASLHSTLSIVGVAALGRSFYTNNPSVSIYRDNDTTTVPRSRSVYIRNHDLAAGPKNAYSLGFNYRSKKYWYANINGNYFDRNYVSVNPDRRTAEATGLIDPLSESYHSILAQEQLPVFYTINLFFGKSFLLSRFMKRLPRNTFLYLNIGVNNLLNNTSIQTGGFEQLRFDFAEKDPEKFPVKYFYGYGINYFINISLKY